MKEVISILVTLAVAVVIYETLKPKKDHNSTNHMYDKEDQDDQ